MHCSVVFPEETVLTEVVHCLGLLISFMSGISVVIYGDSHVDLLLALLKIMTDYKAAYMLTIAISIIITNYNKVKCCGQ